MREDFCYSSGNILLSVVKRASGSASRARHCGAATSQGALPQTLLRGCPLGSELRGFVDCPKVLEPCGTARSFGGQTLGKLSPTACGPVHRGARTGYQKAKVNMDCFTSQQTDHFVFSKCGKIQERSWGHSARHRGYGNENGFNGRTDVWTNEDIMASQVI
ncbi:Reticulophagy Regulator 3 [Manis pentadactyla]|nr:Reticulophagy Regulator 3 [Manis pentadactyla]